MTRALRVVHLPYYDDNAYQPLLLASLKKLGVDAEPGGGGGRFFRTALWHWKADVLHFHWLHPYVIRPTALQTFVRGLGFLAQTAILKVLGQRIVWTVHNLHNHDGCQLGLEGRFARWFSRLADRMIAHSPKAKHDADLFLALSDSCKTVVVPHGNYIDCYPNEISREEARRQLGLQQHQLVFLFFGRIEPYKGVLDLIDAFRRLSVSSAALVIAGRTPNDEATRLIARASAADQRILFRPGFVPDAEVQTLMQAADVVVFPYREIFTSGALVLAMSFGKACIAAKRGCIPDTLHPDGGILFAAEQEGALLHALQQACRAPERLPAMGKRNFERARLWSWDAIAQRTLSIYQDVIGHRTAN